jgi:hypothetical protein
MERCLFSLVRVSAIRLIPTFSYIPLFSAWLTIREVALAEIYARTVSPDGRCIGCPHCGNRVRTNGLMDHIEEG